MTDALCSTCVPDGTEVTIFMNKEILNISIRISSIPDVLLPSNPQYMLWLFFFCLWPHFL